MKLAANQKLLHWQANQHLYYESVKDEAKREYKYYLEQSKATEQEPKTGFDFWIMHCQKCFVEETEDVKMGVKDY